MVLRLFVLLCDGVTKYTGSTRFLNIKKTKSILRKIGFWNRWLLSKKIKEWLNDEENIQFFEGNFGDIAIVNPQHCLHAASIPENGNYRDILQFEIYPSKKSFDKIDNLFHSIPDNFNFE